MSEMEPTRDEGGADARLLARLTASVVSVVRRLPPAGPRPTVISAPCLLVPDHRPGRWAWRLVPTVVPPKLPPELARRIFGDRDAAGRPVNLSLTVQPVRAALPWVRPWMTIHPTPAAGPVHVTLVFPRGERRCFRIVPADEAGHGSATAEPLHPYAFAFPPATPLRVAICDRPPPPRTTRIQIRFARPSQRGLGTVDRLRLLAQAIRALSAAGNDERTFQAPEADRRLLAAILGEFPTTAPAE